ncbi:CD109 antigen-like [Pomacea canaliculata]|uniref:CD109 antigen-like n=1 Tax=Pomacea canaliculata TaxID=400727 RepID=UPI000D72DD7B|nr:CD109 antigen-like [Pomacea canaliculata]
MLLLMVCALMATATWSQEFEPRSFLPPNPYISSPARFDGTYVGPISTRQTYRSGKYLLTAPQIAIPGFNFTMMFESFMDEPVRLQARIYSRTYDSLSRIFTYPTVVTTSGSFVKGERGVLDLPIPANLMPDNSYYWEVGCDTCTFLNTGGTPEEHATKYYLNNYLSVKGDVTTILVQTDKAIYKPGHIVHYRVFAVYPDLQMYTGTFQIEIRDPNRNIIQRLSESSGRQGVVEGSLTLADKPLFGDWTISVQIQTTTRTDSYSKTFTVQEYNLPRFEVTVDVPSYVLTTDEDLKGSVKATYTFGQPVKGLVELHVSSTQGLDYCGKEPRFMQIAFDIDGEAKFSVPRVDIARVTSTNDGDSIKVTAIVKETLTDVKLQGSAVVTYRSTPYKVTILDNTPGVFKPGLPFSVFAKASMQDDSPVAGATTMTIFTMAHYNIPADNSFLYGVSQFTGTYPLPVRTIDVPPSGVVKIDIDIPSNATSLDVTVDFKGVTAIKNIYKMFSISNNYLQLTLLDKNLKSGQTARIQAKATEPIGRLWYQVLSRGIVYEATSVDAKGQHLLVITIPVTPDLAPTAHMMAYYVRPDLEIVADSIAFNVDGIFENEVTLELSTNKSEPHTDLDVYLTADPDSMVYLLAVDQSVLLMKTGNDVTPDEVADAAASYSVGKKPSDSEFALSLSQQNIAGTIQGAGVSVLSDANLYATSAPTGELPKDPSIYGPDVHVLATLPPLPNLFPGGVDSGFMRPEAHLPMFSTTPSLNGLMGGSMDALKNQPLQEVERVRNLFPETWLWLNQTVGRNGTATIHTTVPDTITSWITTAFATNLQSGLGITSSAAKLTVFRSFFVSLTLPTSVIRGEYVVVQASVFNYLPSDVSVLVTLPASHEYSSVVITSDGSEAIDSGDQERAVTVKSNEQAVVYFPIIPTALGAIDIEVSARSTLAADAERRQLNVEAEGVPNEFSIPVFINLGPNGSDTFTQTFPITVPSDVVEGSSRSRIKVTGDILGPSVDGLDTLLRMPTGCGEQNMIRMAPNLYVSNYLKATGQMTSDLAIRIKNLLETGYQRELTYQRQDGAFSTFGNNDNSGSTWLTAFVLRVFHEARSDVYVDSAVLQRAMDWLIQRQNTDGSFNEFGHIFDPQMRTFGDHSSGLTAFVLLALLENADVPLTIVQKEAYNNATSRALHFLETTHANIADDLSLALTTLTLVKARSPAADVAFAKLMSHSITEHGMTFWKSNETLAINAYSHWRPAYVRARPIDIHVTSYALLVFAAKGLFQEGMSVLHWLTRQRNPYGGFASTQDTMVGLQAMTEFLKEATLSGSDLHLDVRTEHTVPHFDISSTNSLVLQAKELSYIPSEVTFEASGRGVAVTELDVFFNSESDFGEPAFGVSTVLMDDYLNSFKIMICTRWLSAGESGMVVQEVGIPSGFAPDMTSIGNVAGLKRVEQRGRFLDVYIDKVTKNSLCYTVMFDRQDKVAHSQPSYVITQDYYEPSNRATTTYLPTSLRDAAVCDVCRDCC